MLLSVSELSVQYSLSCSCVAEETLGATDASAETSGSTSHVSDLSAPADG